MVLGVIRFAEEGIFSMCFPAGLSLPSIHPSVLAQSKTVSVLCRTRLAVSGNSSQMGRKHGHYLCFFNLVNLLVSNHRETRVWLETLIHCFEGISVQLSLV